MRSPISGVMGWVIVSIWLCLPLAAQNTILTLTDKTELKVPTYLFNNITYLDNSSERIIIRSWDPSGAASFIFISRIHSKDTPYNPITDLTQALGIPNITAGLLGESQTSPKSGNEIMRIETPEEFQDHLIGMVQKNASNQVNTFFLIGPEEEFYEAAPHFNIVTEHFVPSPASYRQAETITSTMIFTAVGLLLLNLGAIWFGLREIAVMKSAE